MKVWIRWSVLSLLILVIGGPIFAWAQLDEIVLPAPVIDGQISLEAAIASRRSMKEFAPTPLTREQIGQLAWAAQGITEPEKGFRSAPSAGAMYPIQLYLVTAEGAYRYVPAGHKLERLPVADALVAFRAATANQPSIQVAPVTFIITASFGPMRDRFGERADPFVYMEAGHIGQNLQLQATALGLGSLPIGGFDPARVSEALSLPAEHTVIYLMTIGHPVASEPE